MRISDKMNSITSIFQPSVLWLQVLITMENLKHASSSSFAFICKKEYSAIQIRIQWPLYCWDIEMNKTISMPSKSFSLCFKLPFIYTLFVPPKMWGSFGFLFDFVLFLLLITNKWTKWPAAAQSSQNESCVFQYFVLKSLKCYLNGVLF